jgi:hypothetical protein
MYLSDLISIDCHHRSTRFGVDPSKPVAKASVAAADKAVL